MPIYKGKRTMKKFICLLIAYMFSISSISAFAQENYEIMFDCNFKLVSQYECKNGDFYTYEDGQFKESSDGDMNFKILIDIKKGTVVLAGNDGETPLTQFSGYNHMSFVQNTNTTDTNKHLMQLTTTTTIFFPLFNDEGIHPSSILENHVEGGKMPAVHSRQRSSTKMRTVYLSNYTGFCKRH